MEWIKVHFFSHSLKSLKGLKKEDFYNMRYEEVNPLEEHTNTPYLSLRVSSSPAYDKKALKIWRKKASDKAALFPALHQGIRQGEKFVLSPFALLSIVLYFGCSMIECVAHL